MMCCCQVEAITLDKGDIITIGTLSTRGGQKLHGKKRHLTIEDNVTIYAGASILGGDTIIGHDSVIGGNAFITTFIPSNTRVSIKNQELEYKQRSKKIEVLQTLLKVKSGII